ncbi:molybdate ABC transporter ATP-binding protein ModF [Vibrio sp. HA2012]|uniref:molybdate ABC transporter ATP-binding protein ModF n=1 Tax=Vibrio sp. HA2012 TaxID=1971595 RepID=UPI000C2BC354|nr:molybdate ABC transporter ATP-binding protein ModF [Vibrio sp. HA2012]PJC85955.1 molybdate ABC transporter ATP-binding protein ModF [Vibrio sp. HA2012]
MNIQFKQFKASGTTFDLDISDWIIKDKQSWGIFSTVGDIGSLLGDLVCGKPLEVSGGFHSGATGVAQVSLAEQQRLLETELANDDTDFMDQPDTGTTVYELIYQQCKDRSLTRNLIKDLDLIHLQESGFRLLSTGETRRLMLARALAEKPELLVLDEPYAGLDIVHRRTLANYLRELSSTVQMLVIVSREEEMPDWIDQVAIFNQGKLEDTMPKQDWDNHPIISQLKALSQQRSQEMLALIQRHKHSSDLSDPVFQLTDGKVAYTDKTIFTDINWRINKGEHWQVRGPNGCGKSTLLGLIFGDHPQCYSNDIQIFGKQRGSGETIWEIKKHIGLVSSALHLQYRVSCSALDVILSGFYDSIGLYQNPSKREISIAREWLKILHMAELGNTSFRALEYGQQRLLLIARAIVKQPAFLILDEPYQGLDFLGRKLVMNTLELIAEENLCQLLYVSHYQDDALKSIKNYLDFIPSKEHEGYQVIVSQLS